MKFFGIVLGIIASICLIAGGVYTIVTQSASFRTGLVITGSGAIVIGSVLTLAGLYAAYSVCCMISDENEKE